MYPKLTRKLLVILAGALAAFACDPDARTKGQPENTLWIDAAYPRMGTTGTEITLTGEDFGGSPGRVLIAGQVAEPISWNSKEVHVRVPPGVRKGRVYLEIVASDLRSNKLPYYQRGPGVWMPYLRNEGLATAAAMWTGRELLLWGGDSLALPLEGGARYNPATDSWVEINEAGAPAARENAIVAWSGEALFVVGGSRPVGSDYGSYEKLHDGARYDPFRDEWRPITVPTTKPDESLRGLWCADHLYVFGLSGYEPDAQASMAAYSPDDDAWSPIENAQAPYVTESTLLACAGDWLVVWNKSPKVVMDPEPTEPPAARPAAGRLDMRRGQWQPVSNENAPPQSVGASAVWTGTELILWGGLQEDRAYGRADGNETNAGAAYDPQADVWRTLPDANAPAPRARHTAVWTGEKMLVYGGGFARTYCYFDGLSDVCNDVFYELPGVYEYEPLTDKWTGIADDYAWPATRSGHKAIWTGTEMLVWGGRHAWEAPQGGLRYNAVEHTWSTFTANGPMVRYGGRAVWTGAEMILWQTALASGQRYVPASDTWLPMPALDIANPWSPPGGSLVWTGAEVLLWGGGYDTTAQGARFLPATSEWRAMTAAAVPKARASHSTVWTGAEMIVWGGVLGFSGTGNALHTGGRYNPVLDSWRSTATSGAPAARYYHTAVWTGHEMLVWGGEADQDFHWECLSNGARYDAGADTWQPMGQSGAPAACVGHVAAWLGDEMLIWSGAEVGLDHYVLHDDGAIYNPVSDRWRAMSASGAPLRRTNALSAWTGTQLFVWGGTDKEWLADGATYQPDKDVWLPMSVPTKKDRSNYFYSLSGDNEGVWTGREILTREGVFTQE